MKSLTPYLIALSAISLPVAVPALVIAMILLERLLFGTHNLESFDVVRAVLVAIGIDE